MNLNVFLGRQENFTDLEEHLTGTARLAEPGGGMMLVTNLTSGGRSNSRYR